MKREELRVTLPSLLWLLIFVGVPTLLVFAIAFKSPDGRGGMGQGWSLSAIRSLASPHYPQIIWRTLWISTVTTFLCLCIALPVAWTMARASRRAKSWLLLFVVIPFWTNFLIRVFAWKQILHAEGLFARILKQWHWMDPDATLLYHPMAVVLVSVYAFLPFAILPIYAVAEKFDFLFWKLHAIWVPEVSGRSITFFFQESVAALPLQRLLSLSQCSDPT